MAQKRAKRALPIARPADRIPAAALAKPAAYRAKTRLYRDCVRERRSKRRIDSSRSPACNRSASMASMSERTNSGWTHARAARSACPELRVAIDTPGCRTSGVIVATTFTDPLLYPKEDIADLYHDRWHVEPDIRASKIAPQMDHLRCKTPFMVEEEIWAHFPGYNLIRRAACQAAWLQQTQPRAVSFTATPQTLEAARGQLTRASLAEQVRQGELLLREIGKERVGHRPDRYEPRLVKRRPKQYKHLREPRAQARARLGKKKAG